MTPVTVVDVWAQEHSCKSKRSGSNKNLYPAAVRFIMLILISGIIVKRIRADLSG
jgi:hypothetical protein